jgi:DNA-binding NarL/FixJ family response regulator
MEPSADTVVLTGVESIWPDHLDEQLRASGFVPMHVDSVHHVALLALHHNVRALVADARSLSFGDVVVLRRLRTQAPAIPLIVVGTGSTWQALKEALDSGATAFVPRGQLPGVLVETLRSIRHEVPHAG